MHMCIYIICVCEVGAFLQLKTVLYGYSVFYFHLIGNHGKRIMVNNG